MPDGVIVAGHICLDIIPHLERDGEDVRSLLAPGKLLNIGPAVIATGGAVSNTGLALHRLGMPVRLAGKVGDDLFGKAVLDVLRGEGAGLADGMIVAPGESTSYTFVISPPGVDRIFLHCPGANDTFTAADLDQALLAGAGLLHFGYPPLMRCMYRDGGRELAGLLARAKSLGLTTSLDMAMPDPSAESGRTDWRALLQLVLPHVDIFAPSIEELAFMLNRDGADALVAALSGETLSEFGAWVTGAGAAVVAIKLGDQGLYIRTTRDTARMGDLGACRPGDAASWCGRELLAPCFEVDVCGTTGAGDATVAGLLAGFWKGVGPEASITSAAAVGACNVERPDAFSGIVAWDVVQRRLSKGWRRRDVRLELPAWRRDATTGLFVGPKDRS